KVDATMCSGEENCQKGERCLTHELWMGLSKRIYDFLDSISLEDFLSRPAIQEIIERQDGRRVSTRTDGNTVAWADE
ncbi:MAG: Rrf2 family transcriptional regulator, partial [Gammaproteobacteria bacterium]|nr:Rrf2 family transcriptional regulator [Gammaproteobacteria bacterium]